VRSAIVRGTVEAIGGGCLIAAGWIAGVVEGLVVTGVVLILAATFGGVPRRP
jgi:hypothetical protein